ncbi:hypothetical protein [Shewanella livingstonensis]|nr:hypothetical protein [Shewanella livingstonensis]
MKLKLIAAGLIGATSLGLSGCVISVGDHKSAKILTIGKLNKIKTVTC